MKLKQSIYTILIIMFSILLIISTISLGADLFSPEEFKGNITTPTGADNVKDVGGKVVGLIRVVGTIVSVGMLMILGIKYMMGSVEERAEYKKMLLPYVIGAILLFAATNLTQIIYIWAKNLK